MITFIKASSLSVKSVMYECLLLFSRRKALLMMMIVDLMALSHTLWEKCVHKLSSFWWKWKCLQVENVCLLSACRYIHVYYTSIFRKSVKVEMWCDVFWIVWQMRKLVTAQMMGIIEQVTGHGHNMTADEEGNSSDDDASDITINAGGDDAITTVEEEDLRQHILHSRHELSDYDCYERVARYFSQNCFSIAKVCSNSCLYAFILLLSLSFLQTDMTCVLGMYMKRVCVHVQRYFFNMRICILFHFLHSIHPSLFLSHSLCLFLCIHETFFDWLLHHICSKQENLPFFCVELKLFCVCTNRTDFL